MSTPMRASTPRHLMKDTAIIQTESYTVGTDGSQIHTFSDGGTVQCMIQPDQSSVGREYERMTGRVRFALYFPATTIAFTAATIAKNYRVKIGSLWYRVLGPALDLCTMGVVNVVYVEIDT